MAPGSNSLGSLVNRDRVAELPIVSGEMGHAAGASDSGDVASSAVASLVAWLQDHPHEPERAPVPGASLEQRRRLSALGGVAAALLPTNETPELPSGLGVWLDAPRPPAELVARVKRLKMPADQVLAQIYCALLPPSGRRVLGTFFTPPTVVGEMVALSGTLIVEPPSVVIDPGAGVGAFTGAALRRWPRSEVHAVDVNVVTLGLLAARSASLTSGARRRLRLHHADYLQWIRSSRPEPTGPVLTIGNPPYTRHQLLSSEQKNAGLAAAGALLDNRNSSLAGYIVAATLGCLRPADSAVLLLPANWLHANYASTVREWLWKRRAREVEVRLLQEPGLFPDANITASVLAVGPVRKSGRLTLDFGGAKRVVEASARIEPSPTDWRGYVRGEGDPALAGSTVCLSDIFRVRRGAATGANGFFVIDEDLAKRLNSEWVVRAASRLHSLDDDFLDESVHDRLSKGGAKCWILRIPPDADTSRIGWYLSEGVAAGVPLRHLATRRSKWWSIEQLPAPRLLLQPMTKHRFKIVVNHVQAYHTNTLYGLYPLGLRARVVDQVASWLRSDDGQEALTRVARPLSSGLLRVEPKAVGALRLPQSLADGLGGASAPESDKVKRPL